MQETPSNDGHYCDRRNKGGEQHIMETRMEFYRELDIWLIVYQGSTPWWRREKKVQHFLSLWRVMLRKRWLDAAAQQLF